MTAVSAPPGADPALVGPWLSASTGQPAWRDCEIELISGGKSNLTFVVSSPAGSVVLRRPPTGHVLPTAHDMMRESRVLRALHGTAVPVPGVIAVESTGELLGAPFYVMEKVDGYIVRGQLPPGYADDVAGRQLITQRLVGTLADLHAVHPESVGLGDFGRPAGFLARQVRRWSQQWEASRTEALPALDALAADLTAQVPQDGDHTIVHGDYRLDNCILDPADVGRIAAVLDWEMSTLGDPLADVGMLVVYWTDQGEGGTVTPNMAAMGGFPSRRELAQLYATATGRDLSRLPFYVAFGYFKLAVIVQGIVARVAAGAMGGQSFELAGQVADLVEQGRSCLADGTLS